MLYHLHKSPTEQKELPRVSSYTLLKAVLTGQRLWRVHSPLEYLHQFPNYSSLIRSSPAFFRSSLFELLKQAQKFRSHRQMTITPSFETTYAKTSDSMS